jgi:hypothetical protein
MINLDRSIRQLELSLNRGHCLPNVRLCHRQSGISLLESLSRSQQFTTCEVVHTRTYDRDPSRSRKQHQYPTTGLIDDHLQVAVLTHLTGYCARYCRMQAAREGSGQRSGKQSAVTHATNLMEKVAEV